MDFDGVHNRTLSGRDDEHSQLFISKGIALTAWQGIEQLPLGHGVGIGRG